MTSLTKVTVASSSPYSSSSKPTVHQCPGTCWILLPCSNPAVVALIIGMVQLHSYTDGALVKLNTPDGDQDACTALDTGAGPKSRPLWLPKRKSVTTRVVSGPELELDFICLAFVQFLSLLFISHRVIHPPVSHLTFKSRMRVKDSGPPQACVCLTCTPLHYFSTVHCCPHPGCPPVMTTPLVVDLWGVCGGPFTAVPPCTSH